jgi:hypothetical protein
VDQARPETGVVDEPVRRVAEHVLDLRSEPDRRRRCAPDHVRDHRDVPDQGVNVVQQVIHRTHLE